MTRQIAPQLAKLLLLTIVLHPRFAFAYIDPNAGGVLFQLLAPIFAALIGGWLFMRRVIGNALRSLWRRITGKADR
ncbi:hypothetical protein [Piscinibacter sp. HJYY11]|uniref:hypothetical protein n=1 Tax=Piscinibacter sp. HJYY11 TaxID=2801333 RepID=UPI00191DEEEB|nr:hypothetical protein [Piscinibacter sp. HJYY11]MBL0727925.1 hypothetical protein [Piscinibacter sp. HJYY11]